MLKFHAAKIGGFLKSVHDPFLAKNYQILIYVDKMKKIQNCLSKNSRLFTRENQKTAYQITYAFSG